MSSKIDIGVGIIGLVLGISALSYSALGFSEAQLWIVAIPLIAFGLNATLRGRKNLKIEKGRGIYTLSADPNSVHFLLHSYRSWQSGQLAFLSDQYEAKTRKRSLALLVELLLSDEKIRIALETAFKISPPERDEIFLSIVPGSYLLTNTRIYLFGHVARSIPLGSIESYASHLGPPTSCTLRLHSGEIISPLALAQVPGEEILNRLSASGAQSLNKPH